MCVAPYLLVFLLQFRESEFQLRTRATHAAQSTGLGGPLHDHIVTTYGISQDSILNTSRFFHIVDGLLPDIMHDILEGTLQLVLKYLLRYLVLDQKAFSLETLNRRIRSFTYGKADSRNKPSPIDDKTLKCTTNTLKQSGIYVHSGFSIIACPPICVHACRA